MYIIYIMLDYDRNELSGFWIKQTQPCCYLNVIVSANGLINLSLLYLTLCL